MTAFEVDSGPTRIDVRVHPVLFGFRVRVSGVTGRISATRLGDGLDLAAGVDAEVEMNVDDLDFGSALLTRTIRGAVDLAGDGRVAGRLIEVTELPDAPADGYRFSFVVESGPLQGHLTAVCRVEWRDDGAAVVRGTTEFSAADFDLHGPGIDHLRGTCEWTVVAVPPAHRARRTS